ncbi:hypothetical protein EAG_14079 [Camponotus floridanus]|uniref:Uncharacterized protein n=1 Tax=Camponotus floridanus TaxID=104421 RepID=E1ZX77_CAMFO|nr:hypothetical protein EAG_14079 [Camponotus floridanus]
MSVDKLTSNRILLRQGRGMGEQEEREDATKKTRGRNREYPGREEAKKGLWRASYTYAECTYLRRDVRAAANAAGLSPPYCRESSNEPTPSSDNRNSASTGCAVVSDRDLCAKIVTKDRNTRQQQLLLSFELGQRTTVGRRQQSIPKL